MGLSLLNDFRNLNVPFSLSLSEGVSFKDGRIYNVFGDCYKYDASFNVPDDSTSLAYAFSNCESLNSPIYVDINSSVNDISYMFAGCKNFQQNITIPINCKYWWGVANGSYYNSNSGRYEYMQYRGTIHCYSNDRDYGVGNFPYAFQFGSGFNGNIVFHNVYPKTLYYAFGYDSDFNRNIYIPDSVENMMYCFDYCQNFNQNIHMPANLKDCAYAFYYCSNLNQSIRIPSGVNAYGAFMYCNNLNQVMSLPLESNLSYMFYSCRNLNQSLYVPYYNTEYNTNYEYNVWENSSALISTNGGGLFMYCTNLNRPITFDDNIESLVTTLSGCENFNQIVTMPSHLKISHGTFSGCYQSFNQYITFPEGVIEMSETFGSCYNFNQNISIPSTVKKLTGCFRGTTINHNIQIPSGCVDTAEMFAWCSRLNQDIYIPSSVQNVAYMFGGCTNYNGNPVLPQGVINCQGFANGCNNLYMSQAVIPSSAQVIETAFNDTKVLNINIQCTNLLYGWSTVNVALAANTSGKTPMSLPQNIYGYDYTFLYEEWQQISWGTPIGELRIPANSMYSDFPILCNFHALRLAGEGLYSYSQFNEEYNYGGTIYIQTVNDNPINITTPDGPYTVPEYQIVYADYPNATNADDVNYYWYKVTFY